MILTSEIFVRERESEREQNCRERVQLKLERSIGNNEPKAVQRENKKGEVTFRQ